MCVDMMNPSTPYNFLVSFLFLAREGEFFSQHDHWFSLWRCRRKKCSNFHFINFLRYLISNSSLLFLMWNLYRFQQCIRGVMACFFDSKRALFDFSVHGKCYETFFYDRRRQKHSYNTECNDRYLIKNRVWVTSVHTTSIKKQQTTIENLLIKLWNDKERMNCGRKWNRSNPLHPSLKESG